MGVFTIFLCVFEHVTGLRSYALQHKVHASVNPSVNALFFPIISIIWKAEETSNLMIHVFPAWLGQRAQRSRTFFFLLCDYWPRNSAESEMLCFMQYMFLKIPKLKWSWSQTIGSHFSFKLSNKVQCRYICDRQGLGIYPDASPIKKWLGQHLLLLIYYRSPSADAREPRVRRGGQTRKRRGNDNAAPRDRPRARKNAINAPAVSPSLGSTSCGA